jgi:hypothetical protein
VKGGSVPNLTIPQSDILGAHHQGAVACFRHEDGYRSQCGVSSLIARKPYAGCVERHSLMHTRSGGRMHRLACNPSCIGSCVGSRFGTRVKLLEGTGG